MEYTLHTPWFWVFAGWAVVLGFWGKNGVQTVVSVRASVRLILANTRVLVSLYTCTLVHQILSALYEPVRHVCATTRLKKIRTLDKFPTNLACFLHHHEPLFARSQGTTAEAYTDLKEDYHERDQDPNSRQTGSIQALRCRGPPVPA
jgi:hypothetical protein